ncbi:hypothetical protein G6F56_005205 [Rhizopus delemar]|nr:hypothetical protein G6F56_005205 [Rhizopus delemar]
MATANPTSFVPANKNLALTETLKRKSKSLNWRHPEDVQLCKAWLNISNEAITGTSQKVTKMWEKIFEEYESDPCFKDTRPSDSLLCRWSIIRRKLKDAKAMYMALETGNRLFIFEHCYKILSTNPTWQNVLDFSKEKTGASRRKKKLKKRTTKKKLPDRLAAQKARRLDAYFEIMAANQEKRDAADVELMATINKQNALI